MYKRNKEKKVNCRAKIKKKERSDFMKQIKEEKGITLIALVVTIVVLLILAGISINAIIGDNGIVGKAKEAQNKMENAIESDKNALNSLSAWMDEMLRPEPIDKTTSYVGYYADFEGDGEVDGIIYADLAIGASGTWSTTNSSTYSYSAVTDKTTLKDYYISKESYKPKNASEEELAFEEKPVLTPIAGEKAERFYVMALSDVTSTETTNNLFCWYDAANDNGITEYSSVTSTGFGTGKNNTTVMLNAWNAEPPAYGARNDNASYKDMWGYVKEGWFVPSKDEWSAFAKAFDITSSDYGNYGLGAWYCSSSLSNTTTAWGARFGRGFMYYYYLSDYSYVRLSATF